MPTRNTRVATLAVVPLGLALALGLGLGTSSCASKKDSCSDFPLTVGFQPLEPAQPTDAWPPVYNATPAHTWARGTTTVPYPIAKVYQALQNPAASALVLPNPGGGDVWTSSPAGEPFPISFSIHYTAHQQGVTVEWDIVYRGGVTQGTPAAPQEIQFRYQKTCGTDYITLEEGSLVARTTADPNVTELQMVGWLVAYTQGPADVGGTLTDWLASLTAVLAALPP